MDIEDLKIGIIGDGLIGSFLKNLLTINEKDL